MAHLGKVALCRNAWNSGASNQQFPNGDDLVADQLDQGESFGSPDFGNVGRQDRNDHIPLESLIVHVWRRSINDHRSDFCAAFDWTRKEGNARPLPRLQAGNSNEAAAHNATTGYLKKPVLISIVEQTQDGEQWWQYRMRS